MIVTLDDLEVATVPTRDADGVTWKFQDLVGWWRSRIRSDSEDMPDADGAFESSKSLRSSKQMALEGLITARSSEAAVAFGYLRLNNLAPTGERVELKVTDPAGTFTMMVRLTSVDVQPFGENRARFQIGLNAADPRKYGPVETLRALPAGSSSEDGLRYPLMGARQVGVLDFGEFRPSGLVQFTNADRGAPSWVTFEVLGSIDNAGFEIISGNDVIKYAGAVPNGQVLRLDPYAGGRAILSGVDVTGERLVRADWAPILPGQTRSYVFDPLGTAGANARMTAQFRKAWW